MSLCDYLEDKGVTCFYGISFYKTEYEIDNKKSGVASTCEETRFFHTGDKLPLKTNYYLYPKDFFIYDYISNERIIHIVEDETYKGYKCVDECDIDYSNSYVVSANGLEILDIKSKNDLIELQNHWNECKQRYADIKLKYFPNGDVSMFMSNITKYNELKPLCNRELDAVVEEFKTIWVKEDEFYIEKRYGVLIEALKNLYWDLKDVLNLSDKEKAFSLSLAYEELDVFLYANKDAKERYLKLFDFVPEFYVNNIINMVEEIIN